MSLGSRSKLLSLRYNAVKCSNCHRVGLTFRTLPVRRKEKQKPNGANKGDNKSRDREIESNVSECKR